MLTRLNAIDRLYLFYLAAVVLLALWHGPGALRVPAWHAFIATAILLLAVNASRSKVLGFLHDWHPLAMFIFSFEEIAHFSLSLVPHWNDARVLAFEQRVFRGSPNLWLGHFRSPALSEFMDLGYFSYYPMFPLIGGLLYGHGKREIFRRLALSSVLMYLMAFTVDLTFPLEGPRRALPGLFLR